jgi:putative ABC transport system permease protein
MIGVGLVAFITIFASSTTASNNATVDRTFTGDIVITGAGMGGGGVDPALPAKLAALAAVKHLTAQAAPGATVQDQAGYKADQASQINKLLDFIYALLALAIVVALLGIGNTLALSIFERTRELGVMRAVGMTRRQLRSTIRWESVIIALQGTVLGLAVGVFVGWALVLAQKNQGLTVFSVPYQTPLLVIVLAGVAGVAAAILPSRRAAKLNVLRAIVTE